MDRNSRAERNAKIYARRIDGMTLAAIAHEFDLAIETIREITKRMERKAKGLKYAAQRRGEDN
jgi:transposase